MPASEEWQGKPHVLIVRSVRLPERPLDDGDLGDYTLKHPRSCGQRTVYGILREYTCDVGWQENESGLPFSLRYSGTPVTEPGVYRIQGWGSKSWYHEFGAYEYDAGVAVLEMVRRLSIVPPLCIDGREYARRQRARRKRARRDAR